MPHTTPAFPSTHPSVLAAVRDRHREAWGRFYLRYRGVIRTWCRRRGLDAATADDLTQSLMADLPRKLDSYSRTDADGGTNPFRGWLKCVVGHLVCDHRRLAARKPGGYGGGGDDHRDHLNGLPWDAGRGVEDVVLDARRADLDRVVEAVRGRVRTATWEMYERHALLGEPAAPVAASVGRTVGALYVAVHRVNSLLAAEYRSLFPVAADGPRPDARHDPVPPSDRPHPVPRRRATRRPDGGG